MATDLEGRPSTIAAETVRHRAQQAVDYYKKQVLSHGGHIEKAGMIPGHQYDRVVGQSYNGLHRTGSAKDSYRVHVSQNSAFQRAQFPAGQGDGQNGYTPNNIPVNRHRATVHGLRSKERSWLQSRGGGRSSTSNNDNNVSGGSARKEKGFDSPKSDVVKSHDRAIQSSVKKRLFNKPGIHRSNSDLELDSIEHDLSETPPPIMPLRREYGSTSSLDVLSNNSSESFFAMLKDYQTENLDQRSPAPPKIQELLRGKLDLENGKAGRGRSHTASIIQANGSVPTDKENESSGSSQSPRPKTKTKPHKDRKARAKSITGEGSTGIFKKLRGAKPENSEPGGKAAGEMSSAETDAKSEERLRRKAFVHFDCRSLGVSLSEMVQNKASGMKRKNTTTGASAASANRNSIPNCRDDPDILSETDDGDEKSSGMVLSCPYFRNELGGEEERIISLARSTAHRSAPLSHNSVFKGTMSYIRHPTSCGVSILDSSSSPLTNQQLPSLVSHRGHVMEYVDHGACYYRHFFHTSEHQNYSGLDENLGPVAISIRRERLEERENNQGKSDYGQYQYRLVCRTSELTTLRGAILEDAIPSSTRLSSSRGVPMKDVLEYVIPELQVSCLRLATPGAKTAEQLLKLDEQGLSSTYKVGIMYCKAGQSTEEEMYNNESAGPAFDEFLDCIGKRVRLKGFEKYRAQLDNKTDSTGTHSLYATFEEYEIMFHVSSLLPHTPNNKQQLLRKRHIGNDIVTIVFQEPGALPFTPKTVRSHFQHVFIIIKVHNPNTDNVRYSVAVSRSKDVPAFGPPIPEDATFSKSQEFADFLLAKVINGENAVHRSEKFIAMATRTRQEYMKDLAINYVTSTSLDSGSKLSKFALGSGRKKEKNKVKVTPDLFAKGAVVWTVQVEDFGCSTQIVCQLGIAAGTIVLIENQNKEVVFTVPCDRILGWTKQGPSLRLYYDHGECVMMKSKALDSEEIQEIISRLTAVTTGSETFEIPLKRNGMGQLGFHVHPDGLITDVEPYSFAWQAGLRQGAQLVEICKIAVATLTHDQMVDLLRTSAIVKVVVIPPHDDGTPRVSNKPLLSKVNLMTQSANFPQSDLVLSSNRRSDETQNSHDSSESYSIRQGLSDSQSSSGEDHHSRHSSHDSSEYPPQSGNRQWVTRPGSLASSHTQSQGNKSTWYGENQSESSSHATSSGQTNSGTDNNYCNMSQNTSSAYMAMRAPRAAGEHYSDRPAAPATGNINQELMKQSQNTKFLLSQGKESHHGLMTTDFTASVNSSLSSSSEQPFSQISGSVSHGSTQTSSLGPGPGNGPYQAKDRYYGDQSRYPVRDEVGMMKKRPDLYSLNTKGRPGGPNHKRSHLDISPLSSNSSSPRSSNRNLSGMSSEESLTTRLRPGVTTNSRVPGQANSKQFTTVSSSFQEDLMRLINPEISEIEITNYSAPPRPGRLQRAVSDESLHSVKAASSNLHLETIAGTDVIFTTAGPTHHVHLPPQKMQELAVQQRMSPRAVVESATVRRPGSAKSSDSPSFPLPDSATGIEWSSLVDVATKAIEGGDPDKPVRSKPRRSPDGQYTTLEEGPVQRRDEPQAAMTSSVTSSAIWRSVASNPQQRIEELEQRVQLLQQQLDLERRENVNLENEVQDLRRDNVRLQDESQVAAAQLRKFTEWFFSTIDRQ